MSGAPVTFTQYKNGIHVTNARPSFITCPELEREMARAFDAGEDVAQLMWDGSLAPLVGLILPAIDNLFAQDKRGEAHPDTPVKMALRNGELHPVGQ